MTVRSLIYYLYTDRDIFDFVMYYIYGQSGPSLLIESTDSMIIIITKNELASLAHSFSYTCLKHQLMLASIIVLLSSTLDYVACMMLDPPL